MPGDKRGEKHMPRMKPPRGYYTLTEAARRLNLSNAMVRRYVEKGKLRYMTPEGREHGFYLKKDVDTLANELNAFLNIEDEEEKVTLHLVAATKEDLAEIAKIANALFAPGNKVTIPNWRYMLLERNPEAQYALKQSDRVVGFATILPLKPGTTAIERLLRSDTVSQANITASELEIFEPGKHMDLYIGAIGIDPRLEKHQRRRYGAALASRLISAIVDLGKRGVVLDRVVAMGATHNGIRLLQTFGLYGIEPKAPGKRAFVMNIAESGSPVSMQYKEALRESKLTEE
jgi:excisionase family DNA binding protein